jgi:hypothetical protein
MLETLLARIHDEANYTGHKGASTQLQILTHNIRNTAECNGLWVIQRQSFPFEPSLPSVVDLWGHIVSVKWASKVASPADLYCIALDDDSVELRRNDGTGGTWTVTDVEHPQMESSWWRIYYTPASTDDCCICQDAGVDFELTPCNHVFHAHCLARWIRSGGRTCPICRASIPRLTA